LPTPSSLISAAKAAGKATGNRAAGSSLLAAAGKLPRTATPNTGGDDGWKPVLSVGQNLINTLATPMYFVEGVVANSGDLSKGALNVYNAFSGSSDVITGKDILQRATGNDPGFWGGLAADIALDPLTYTPGAFISVPAKTLAKSGVTAARAAKLAGQGLVAGERGAARATTEGAARLINTPKTFIKSGFTEASPNVGGKILRENMPKLQEQAVPLYKVGERSTVESLLDIANNAVIGAWKGAVLGAKQGITGEALRKAAKADAKAVRAGKTPEVVPVPPSLVEKLADEVATPTATEKVETATAAVAKDVAKKESPVVAGPIAAILDTEPTLLDAAAVKVSNVDTVKDAKARLRAADKIAKSATTGGENVAAAVLKLIPSKKDLNAVSPDLLRIISTVREKGKPEPSLIVPTLQRLNNSNGNVLLAIRKLAGEDGAAVIDAITAGKPIAGKALTREMLEDVATAMERYAAVSSPATVMANLRTRLVDLVGEDATLALMKVGALTEGRSAANEALVQKIVADATVGKGGKTYKNATELVAGLAQGDRVAPEILIDLVKALSPEHQILKDADAAAGTPKGYDMLTSLLGKMVPHTIEQTQKRIAAMKPEVLMTQSVAYGDVIAAAIDGARDGALKNVPAVLRETRATADREFEALYNSADPTVRSNFRTTLDSIARGMSGQGAKIIEALETGKKLEVGELGFLVAKTKDASGKTEGFLPELFSQYVETRIWASMVAKRTNFETRNVKSAKRKGTIDSYESSDPLTYLARNYSSMRPAILSLFGVRLVNMRSLAETAQKTKSYHAYVDFGDVATIAKDNPQFRDAIERGFFATYRPEFRGLKSPERNTFQVQSLMRAVVRQMESAEKGLPYSDEELIADLMKSVDSKGIVRGKPNWTEKYAKEAPAIAQELAAFVRSTANEFTDIHKTRALAELDDLLAPTHRMAEDIFTPVLQAVRAKTQQGTLGDSERIDMVWDALMRFAATSDILRAETGAMAQALFRSAARLFMTLGGVDDIVKASVTAAKAGEPGVIAKAVNLENLVKSQKTGEASAEFQRLVADINAIQLNRNKQAELLPAAERYKVPAVEANLAKAYQDFERAAASFGKVSDDEFKAAVKKAQGRLQTARKAAERLGLPTKYWSAERAASDELGLGWVDSKGYDWNKEQLFIRTTKQAAADVKPGSRAKPKLPKPLRKTQSAQVFVINKKTVQAQIAQATEDLADDLRQLEELTPDPTARAARLVEEHSIAPTRGAVIRVPQENPYFYPTSPAGAKKFYQESRVEAVRGNYSRENLSFIQRFGDLINPLGERALTRGMYKRQEITTMQAVADIDSSIRLMWEKSQRLNLGQREFDQAFSTAIALLRNPGAVLPENEAVAELAKGLHAVMSATKSKIDSVVLDPTVLSKVLAKHGISPNNGFIDVAESRPEDMFEEIFSNTPFGPKPIDDGTTEAAQRIQLWEERNANYRKRFNKGDADGAFTSIAKILSAMQFATMQHTLSAELVTRFNYAAEGLTRETALARGYVRVEGTGTGFSFTEAIPENLEADNLFHPDIARSIGAMNREFNRTFNSKDFARWLQGTMEITQALKATQTILRPGHLATTIVGDWGLALMINKFNPQHWAMAMRLNKEYAKQNIAADYRAVNQIQASIDRAVNSIQGVGGRPVQETAAGLEYMTVNIGGKPTRISLEEAVRRFSDNAVLTGNMQTNEAALLDLEFAARTRGFATDANGTDVISDQIKAGRVINKARINWQKFIRPAGDLVAYTSNPARLVSALRVLEEGSFKSLDDAFEAAADKVRLYHPTMDSLTATERRGPRLFFSYYTWLRGAHNAMFDMMLNHTAMMLLPSKIFYNQAEANDMNPQSLGNLWGNKMASPGYLDYSVYGPTMEGPRGGLIYKPSVLQLDVIDTWNLTWDPNLTGSQNAAQTVNTLGRTVLGQSNMVLQPLAQLVTGTNLRTGKPDEIENAQEFGDKYVQLLGFTQALKGLGLYTPYNKIDNQTNPQTPRDEQLAGLNWLFGQRIADTGTPSAIRNAKLEMNETQQNIIDRLLREQENK